VLSNLSPWPATSLTAETWPTLLGNGSQPQGARDAFTASLCATRPHGPTFAGLQVCWTAFRPSSTTAAHTDYGLAMACHLRTVVSRTPRFQSLVPSASDLGSAMGACKYNGCDSESPTTPGKVHRTAVQRSSL
jgi:hypothetical protein